jgi:hypothetical protein
MEMTIDELLFLTSSAIILPTIAVLVFAYFSGALTSTESSRFLALRSPEEDFWAQPGPTANREGE